MFLHLVNIAAITGQQAARLQRHPETYLDLWCTIVGNSIRL